MDPLETSPPKLVLGPGLTPPAPITDSHDVSTFTCGQPALDDWLKRRALPSEARTARTYVVCLVNRVIGYYCMSAGSIQQAEAPRRLKPHGTPLQIPVIIIGRLAVDESFRGQGIGRGLLQEAISRSLQVAGAVGVRAILVHALDEKAANFYAKYGFIGCPLDHRTMVLPIETALTAL